MTSRQFFSIVVRIMGLWLLFTALRQAGAIVYFAWAVSITADIVGRLLAFATPAFLAGLYLLSGGAFIVDRCFPVQDQQPVDARECFRAGVRATGLWIFILGLRTLFQSLYYFLAGLGSWKFSEDLGYLIAELLIGAYLLFGAKFLLNRFMVEVVNVDDTRK